MDPSTRPAATPLAPLRAGKPVGATQNTLRILDYAVDRQESFSAAEAARALGLTPSTCFNIVNTLVAMDWLAGAADTHRYVLGSQLRAMSQRVAAQSRDLSAVLPAMQAVADRWKLTVTVWHRRSAGRMELVAKATCQTAVNIQMPIGQSLPLLVGGMGRIMALQGGLSDAERQAVFDEIRWHRPLSMATLMSQARQAKRLGWGLDDGYMHRSVTALGVPVLGHEETVEYVCSATMFRHQYARVALLSIAESLRPVAAKLGMVLRP